MSETASTALLTDHYELTMLQAALADGTANRRAVFELFGRRLPEGRRYGVVAGVQRCLDAIADFRFGDAELAFLRDAGIVDKQTVDWLARYRFSGQLEAYPDGEIYFPGSPIMTVEATFAEAVLLETVLLSILNHDAAVASAASRMTWWAGGRPCIEMGSRRTAERAAPAAALAAYIAGFTATSNLEAGRIWGIPTTGTSAHAFTLLHDDEKAAFASQIQALGRDTTLLVDTYDVMNAVRMAVELAGPELGAIRLDSGDLPSQAAAVRELLDELGATRTRIIVTSDLDEYQIAALAPAPVDGYGVGTSLVTGSGHPTCGFVYKLVARENSAGELEPVAKKSRNKSSIGGRKSAFRRLSPDGEAQAELIGVNQTPQELRAAGELDDSDRPLQVRFLDGGQAQASLDPASSRARHRRSRDELPRSAMQLSRGEAVLPTDFIGTDPQLTRNPYGRSQV